jgi:hypothetical protein
MTSVWLNDGAPDETGVIVAQTVDDDGKVLSTFKGKTMREVGDAMLHANAAATARIRELKTARQPDRAPLPPALGKPADLSADERFGLRSRMDDPETAADAVAEAVATRLGTTVDGLRENIAAAREQRSSTYYRDEAAAFAQAHPDFVFSAENAKALWDALQLKGWDGTRHNLSIVYDELNSEGRLQTQPQPLGPTGDEAAEDDSDEPPIAAPEPVAAQPQNGRQQGANTPEPTLPASRPRFAAQSTAIRGANPPRNPPKPAPKLTREQIAVMPRDVYARRLAQEPGFRRDVEMAMGARG